MPAGRDPLGSATVLPSAVRAVVRSLAGARKSTAPVMDQAVIKTVIADGRGLVVMPDPFRDV